MTDPDALADVLKDLFAEQKLRRNVRVGIANQRVVVRTLRLPLIEDRDELGPRSASRPPSRSRCRWTRRCSTGRCSSPTPETAAATQMDVVVVAARREAVVGITQAVAAAGLKPGRDRRHRLRDDPRARPRDPRDGRRRAAGLLRGADGRGRRRRRACPRSRPACYCNLGDVTNLAVARGSSCLFTRVSSFGIEGIAQRVAERRELTLEHARQWLVHVGLVTPRRGDRRGSGDRLGVPARRSTRALRSSPASCGSRSTTTAARRARSRSRRSSSAGPAPRSPGCPSSSARARLRASRSAARRRSPTSTRSRAARLTLSYGLGAGGVGCAPST